MTKLIVYVVKGTPFKPGSLVPMHAVRADYVSDDPLNGDAVGVLWARSVEARQILEAVPGITVLPLRQRQLTAAQIALFGYCGAAQGDTTLDLEEKLHKFHLMPWFHPEWFP